MRPDEIVAGAKYANPNGRYGGRRIVDAIIVRRTGKAVRWFNAEPPREQTGRAWGVSTLKTFAGWAREQESMTQAEVDAHRARADLQDQHRAEFAQLMAGATQ